MSVLQARPRGTPTVALTLRIDAEAHRRLRQYALLSEKTMSLAVDDLIFKGTEPKKEGSSDDEI
jgi:hypothetical protein